MLLFTSNYSSGTGLTRYEFKAEAYEQKADNYIETNKTTVVVDIYSSAVTQIFVIER